MDTGVRGRVMVGAASLRVTTPTLTLILTQTLTRRAAMLGIFGFISASKGLIGARARL